MSNFCASCGAATGGGKFCPKCGSPQADGAPSISQSPYAPPRKSPVLKIVLVTLALLFVLGIAAAVKGYYFLKDRVLEAKQELAHMKSSPAEPTQAGCEILSKEKVAEILDTTVAQSKGNRAGDFMEYCKYYAKAQTDADRDGDGDKSDASKNSEPSLQDLESLAKKISTAADDRPLVYAQIYRGNASPPVIAIKTVGRLSGNDEANIPGPWDEAYFGPKDSVLAVRKGSNGVVLTLTIRDKRRETALELAKAIVPSL
jgi:hypothetical protein